MSRVIRFEDRRVGAGELGEYHSVTVGDPAFAIVMVAFQIAGLRIGDRAQAEGVDTAYGILILHPCISAKVLRKRFQDLVTRGPGELITASKTQR